MSVYFVDRVMIFDDVSPDKLTEQDIMTGPSDGLSLLGPATVLDIPRHMPLTRAVEYFVAGISNGGGNRFGLDLAYDVIRVVDASQRSVQAGGAQALAS